MYTHRFLLYTSTLARFIVSLAELGGSRPDAYYKSGEATLFLILFSIRQPAMACLPKGRATGAALGRDVTPTDADSSPGSALGLALHPPKRQRVVRAGKLLRSRPMHACNNAAATAEWSASPRSVAWANEVSMRGTALWVRQRHDLLRGAGSLGARAHHLPYLRHLCVHLPPLCL